MNTTSNKICPLCSGPGRFFYAQPTTGFRYHRCEECQAAWLDPKHYLSRKAEYAHYGMHENDPSDPNYRAFLNRLWAPLSAKLAEGASGLDYGSGPGPTLHRMVREDGFDCLHYDPCFHPDKSVFGQQYDFITCSETAEHFHNPVDEFRQLKALLKPNGWLGVMTSRLMPTIDFAHWHYPRDPSHVFFYTDASFQSIANRLGFNTVEFASNSVVLLQSS